MGQTNSGSNKTLTDDVEIFGEEVYRQARLFSQLATLSYGEFLEYLKKLNSLSQYCMDADGKQLIFIVKKGSDSSVFWKSTVRIACIKLNPITLEVDNCRLMNLNEFLKVFRALNCQYQTALQISKCQEAVEELEVEPGATAVLPDDLNQEPSTSSMTDTKVSESPLSRITTSVMFREVDKAISKPSSSCSFDDNQFTECCICLDRTPNVMLPCAHSYCKQCIEKWNVSNKTCPVCREEVKNSDDAWVVISEAPNSLEVNEELCTTLMNILGNRNRQSDNESSSSCSNSNNVRHIRSVRRVSHSDTTDVEDYMNDDDDDGYYHSTS